MSTHLWGATVLRKFCSSTGLPFFKKGAVPTGPASGHPSQGVTCLGADLPWRDLAWRDLAWRDLAWRDLA